MTHHFRPSLTMPELFLYRDPIDFRKSIRGLAALVEQELGHNPFDGAFSVCLHQPAAQQNQVPVLGKQRIRSLLPGPGRGKIPLATSR